MFFYIIIHEYADFKPEILTKLTNLTILKSVMKKMTKQKAPARLRKEALHPVELIIDKHRNGPTGKIDLFFKSDCAKLSVWMKKKCENLTV